MSARSGSRRQLVLGALAAAVVAVVATIVFSGNDEHAHIRMVMPNALGLREGSGVRLGGVLVGKVSDLSLTDADQIQIDLAINDKDVRLGKTASVAVKSLNLLGEKYVALDPGDADKAPVTDLTIPATRVTSATDLDQVLDVLDADTRTRLAILVNEAGLAMTGRHADFSALLAKLPPALTTATRLLDDVVSDNHTLADLIQHSDRFLARTVRQTGDLNDFIDEAAGAAGTFAARSEALRATLRKAPGGLAQLRGFLTDLRTTAAPLGAAARNISATSPELAATLREIEPFRAAAKPTLRQASAVAPALTKLGEQATPVIRKSLPTLKSLRTFATAAVPLTKVLGISTPDLLGVLEGWGRAIQGRDGRGHAFHGGVTFGAGILQTLLEPPTSGTKAKKQAKTAPPAPTPQAPRTPALPQTLQDLLPKVNERPKKALKELPTKVQELPKTVQDVISGLLGQVSGDRSGGSTGGATSIQSLLDYLLKP